MLWLRPPFDLVFLEVREGSIIQMNPTSAVSPCTTSGAPVLAGATLLTRAHAPFELRIRTIILCPASLYIPAVDQMVRQARLRSYRRWIALSVAWPRMVGPMTDEEAELPTDIMMSTMMSGKGKGKGGAKMKSMAGGVEGAMTAMATEEKLIDPNTVSLWGFVHYHCFHFKYKQKTNLMRTRTTHLMHTIG